MVPVTPTLVIYFPVPFSSPSKDIGFLWEKALLPLRGHFPFFLPCPGPIMKREGSPPPPSFLSRAWSQFVPPLSFLPPLGVRKNNIVIANHCRQKKEGEGEERGDKAKAVAHFFRDHGKNQKMGFSLRECRFVNAHIFFAKLLFKE